MVLRPKRLKMYCLMTKYTMILIKNPLAGGYIQQAFPGGVNTAGIPAYFNNLKFPD